jgi:hypothetical protein
LFVPFTVAVNCWVNPKVTVGVLGAMVTEVTVGLAGGADDELHPVNTRNRTAEAKTQKVLKK